MIKKLLQIAIFKSFFFNLKHFGLKGAKMPVLFAKKCKVQVKGKIELENFSGGAVRIGFGGSEGVVENRYSYLSVAPGARLVFKGKAGFSAGNSVRVDAGVLTVGNNFSANKNCFIACSEGVTIGDDVTLGWDVHIRDNDGHTIIDGATGARSESRNVTIGNHVWLCAYTDVLKGSVVPDESVVAYRSLVTKAFDKPHSLIGGAPAKLLKENIRWEY
ncbi:MAG: acyltransferase [Ruminococcaceae bacterium]|nr:acyltransferase [Oscillospiraceae bacterium]